MNYRSPLCPLIGANNLVRGLIPGPFMNHVPLESENAWEKVSQAYFSYCQPYAHFSEYLILGKCCPPPKIDCSGTNLTSWREDKKYGAPLKEGGELLSKVELEIR